MCKNFHDLSNNRSRLFMRKHRKIINHVWLWNQIKQWKTDRRYQLNILVSNCPIRCRCTNHDNQIVMNWLQTLTNRFQKFYWKLFILYNKTDEITYHKVGIIFHNRCRVNMKGGWTFKCSEYATNKYKGYGVNEEQAKMLR